MRPSGERRWSWAPIAIVVALLLVLAGLQYRWIGEVSRLERLRLEDEIAEAMLDLADDVDREVSRLATLFLLPDVGAIPEALRAWQSESPHPGLLAEVLVWWPGAGGPGADELEHLDPTTGSLEPIDWPTDLRAALPRLRGPRPGADRTATGVPGALPEGPTFTIPNPPVLVVPVFPGPLGDPRRRSPRARRFREGGARLLLRLDESSLRNELLPDLVEEHFGGSAALPVDVTVLRPGPGGEEVVFSNGTNPSTAVGEDSFVIPLLRVRFFPELRAEGRRFGRGADPNGAAPRANRRAPAVGRGVERGGWALVVDAKAGSLDATVARLRWRNLGISAAILGVLAVSLALVLGAARRRQELARRQLALVAGITHELHTPLAALQAAAQNLEDGVVRDPDRIREYGGLVRREGGRLQTLVDQTLALAGMRAGGTALRPEAVALDDAVERAIADSIHTASEAEGAAEVAVEVDLGIPGGEAETLTAWADPDALHRVLVNLLGNARKYGRGRIWIGARETGSRVSVTVVDDGPGVEPTERSALFEPFHRGQRARDLTAAGSGLGLYLARSLVEAMGGELDLIDAGTTDAPAELRGAAFRARLPREPKP